MLWKDITWITLLVRDIYLDRLLFWSGYLTMRYFMPSFIYLLKGWCTYLSLYTTSYVETLIDTFIAD